MKTKFHLYLAIFAISAFLVFPTITFAASTSPFVGHWQAIDVDGSDIRLAIAGPPQGPFQITWTESYISFCGGKAGIVRGTGWLNEGDSNLLEADLHLECFTTGAMRDFHLTFRYHPATNRLSSRYPTGPIIIWHRPGGGRVAEPAALDLRVNYGHDWVESFYEGGHMAWVTLTESDGVTVKGTAELVTEAKDYWGGETGFQTNDSVWFDGDGNALDYPPDIQPYNWVYGWVDNGASAQVQIGEISGTIDLDADSISGEIAAPWFSSEVNVECHPWGAPEPVEMKFDTILPDSNETYSCSWAEEWDIQPRQDVGVGYFGEDGHWVANAFFIPNTRFTVWPEWNYLEGYEWPDGAVVSISVADKEICSTEAFSSFPEWDPSNTFFSVNFPEGCSIEIDDLITLSIESLNLTHQVQELAISEVNLDLNTVAGTAVFDPEQYLLHTWIHGIDGSYMQLSVEDGAWLADFDSKGFDLQPGMGGRVELVDQASNATADEWYIPNPHFYVFPEWDYIIGWEWPAGTLVTAEVYHPGGEETPDCVATTEMSHPEWSEEEYVAEFFLSETCDIQAGDFVLLTGSLMEREHIVFPLQVTTLDPDTDTIGGVAEPDIEVNAWVHGEDGTFQTVMPDVDGNWMVDFSPFDLEPEMGGRVEQYDEDGDATSVDWWIPNPRFTVFPEWEWFDGMDWPDGATVDITVDGKPKCAVAAESLSGFFNGSFGEDCDVEIGNTVTFTDGETIRTHTIQNIAITVVDKVANTVAGTADVGALIYAWVHEYGYEMQLTVEDGTWLADFGSAGLDLVENMGGRAEIRDEFGNATAVDWWIPNPHFTVFPEGEWFDGYDWPDGATVTITVEDKEVCETEGVSSENFFNGGFPEGCDIVIGDVVTFIDGATTRTHEVRNLSISLVDAEANIVAGTADAFAEVFVWPHATGEQVMVTADGEGNWMADFNGMFDLVPDECGRAEIRDVVGNATAVDWCVPPG
jgi:hypothetical protein